jgi:hypothetical protein
VSLRDAGLVVCRSCGVSGVEQPSRGELLALIASQARVIEELTARVAAQDAAHLRDVE